jgi:hypothetical protein
MSTIDHPDWGAYKAALSRLARAGAELEEPAPGLAGETLALGEFRLAVAEFEAMRARLNGGPDMGPAMDGVPASSGPWATPLAGAEAPEA